ncbi:pilus assembly protein [Xanthobacteraceae bacterium Astr-EGSB]|uniref:TadE/TadG family type IV pilus assembly protein n=1 Tax=Astrobacterium formosum TaxID=3069710 RepID=UPI0027B2604C|nr:pilus assembly protein [Xanthobacteraceae bacterium Astr-EGSB]
MSANMLNSVVAGLGRLVPVRRFLRRQDGAAAVEFAIVVLPFLLLMFLIMETGLVFFASQTLETVAADSARLIRTGQGQAFDEAAFKEEVCNRAKVLFSCPSSRGIFVDVQKPTDYDSINRSVELKDGEPVTQFSTDAVKTAKAIVVVRLMYKWPILFPLTAKFLGDSGGGSRMLVATAAFRNEPF